MTTQTIGIKEFRQNMTKLYKKAQKYNICYIVMRHQHPIWKVTPIPSGTKLVDVLKE